jgi:hypothetical protein
MEIDLELKVKLFKEYLENGGYEKIWSIDLLEGLKNVQTLPNGKVDPNSVSPLVNSAMLAYCGAQLLEPHNSIEYLSQYDTLLQKSEFFTQTNIETKSDFDEVFEKFTDSKNILFRGLNDAKYRLYSSLQREWITSKLYEKYDTYQAFLEALVNNARLQQGQVLTKYLNKIGIDSENDLAVLSFLQHYGCPTPLLDWTYSFSNALFFATQGIKKPEGKWEIENYFCVYYLEEEFFEKASMQQLFDIGLTKQKDKLKNELNEYLKSSGVLEGYIDSAIKPEHLEKIFYHLHGKQLMTYITKIERLIETPMLYFSDDKTDNLLKYNLNTNLNIVNQDGVFTWNSSPTKPIENIALEGGNSNEHKKILFSKCININKELKPYVKNRIKKLGITKRYIYPDPWIIAKATYDFTK